MGALDTAVRQGKALYAGISSYSAERTREAAAILRNLGTPLLIHQPSYSMLNRWIEPDLLDALDDVGAGCIAFTALAQGLLTGKYLDGIPEGSRAASEGTLDQGMLDDDHARPGPRPRRHRQGARPVAGSDGAGMGASRSADDVAGDRREQRQAARGERRGARQPRLHRLRARPDRRASRSTPASTCGRRRAASRPATVTRDQSGSRPKPTSSSCSRRRQPAPSGRAATMPAPRYISSRSAIPGSHRLDQVRHRAPSGRRPRRRGPTRG